jgi:type IV pilus assembly protein PilW
MKIQWALKQRGVTLIELLVALVIFGVVIGAIYRLFVAQTRAYTVQDQVVEVQQTVRSVMEILLRDLRMAGYDDDNTASTVTIPIPIATPVQASDITVSYEYYDSILAQYQRHTVRYWRDAGSSTLFRQCTINAVAEAAEPLLENVDALTFTYGVDTNEDGNVDNWVAATGVGVSKVIAVRISLTARPSQINPDVAARVSPRTLTSAVIFRNIIMK